ncbi:uncharacterized protein LOC112348217 [Selaginella moellendorffii]|uniref:uncharacterized protein LOC112348217 n=1 Tax=Selaginella moellendorffii TaxID=88036 RepID=UPI000D1C6CBC|nr:uncharacterized protein LOC112348217 [Selaginella moellendorffii]|eukprot:XP_024536123.1 uncharacterized protein LOC112348217 [Selaginella moellendorffii]
MTKTQRIFHPFALGFKCTLRMTRAPLPEEEDRELEVRRAVIGRRFCIGLWWVKPRNVTTWSKFSLEYYDVGRWKRKLQMVKRTFFTICGMLESEIRKHDTGWRSVVLVDKLFKNTDYLDLADKFGIGESTAHEIFMDTTVAIVKCLRYKIHFPSTAKEVRAVAAGFRQVTGTRLPNVAGAIDCTPRSSDLLDWTARATTIGSSVTRSSCKGFVMPRRGRVHDMRVFRNSTLRNKIVARELLTSPVVLAYDDRIKPYLVGDKGYQLQIPHTTLNPTPSKAAFNLHHHLARIVIEQAFGLLKMKFRCLDQKQRIQPKYLPNIIKSCS